MRIPGLGPQVRACGLLLAAAWLALAAPLRAQEVDELIRARVEELAASGMLEAAGAPIAARNLIPKLYEARGFTPAWKSPQQIEVLLEVVDGSYLEGLDPSDYHADAVRAALAAFASVDALTPAQRADYDLMLTDSVIRLGYHLRFGKLDPVALDPDWNMSRDFVGEDPVKTIQAAIDSRSMRDFAAKVIPRHAIYDGFKRALAEYRAIAANGGWTAVPAGVTLKAGMTDARVPALVLRLAATHDLDASAVDAASTLYDGAVLAGVESFQERHGLTSDGVLGAATLDALNVSVEQRIDQIRANLERARWVLYDPQSAFLVVNIAGFQAYVLRRGEIVWRSRVVVGKPYTRTPVFSANMTYVVVNPTWTIPPSIARNETLPAVRRNLGYLASHNMDAFGPAGTIVDPAAVNWAAANAGSYRFVQRPGPDNALGRIKFMFPNGHNVYLHDTPSRSLFEKDTRAFSHGCIRVDDIHGLAELLLGWDRAKLDAAIDSGRTQTVLLDKPLPVMLLYWTVQADAEGRVTFFQDIYSRDAPVITALAAPFKPSPKI
ncbi:MAG TPA: L,D-transpeptidase family protein [Gammaproteobacteria bacterium]|nr:L,D-transpeptidase family protein [Gammaproteobacteria bacterium]